MKKFLLTTILLLCLFLILGCSKGNVSETASCIEESEPSELVDTNSSPTQDTNSSTADSSTPIASLIHTGGSFIDVWDDMCEESDRKYTFLICSPSGYNKWDEEVPVTITPNPDIEVLINGKMVAARYCGEADIELYEPYITFYYNYGNMGVTADGQLKYYRWDENWDQDSKPLGKYLSQDACEDIAKVFITAHFDVDLNEYKMETLNADNDLIYYEVVFNKYIGDIQTAEKISVKVRKDGELLEFNSCMLGKISPNAEINFDIDTVEGIIDKHIEKRYDTIKQDYDEIQYKINSRVFTILDTGENALIYTIEVYGIGFENASRTYIEGMKLLVK